VGVIHSPPRRATQISYSSGMDPRLVLVATLHLGLFAIGCLLVAIDARTHRLPDRIVLPTLGAVALLVVIDALLTGDRDRLLGAGVGMLALGGFYAVLRALSRDGMGGGDVKLAALIGLVLGWHGWQALALGAAAAFVLGALHAVGLMVSGRADASTRIAFGPWMIIGAVLGILVG